MLRKNAQIFSLWGNEFNKEIEFQKKLSNLGIKLDIATGHLFYSPQFQPLSLNFNLVFVRHGETYGNCGQSTADGKIDTELVKLGVKNIEKRIFQGYVDTDINQLTEHGREQAIDVSEKLKINFLEQGWEPDTIFVSPLTRARETALPFIQNNKFENRCYIHGEIREMSFGAWDNCRVCDILESDRCHLFYREQNALIKSSEIIHPIGENFCEVIFRAHNTLLNLNETHINKNILFFSHSMFGAACCILLGKGQFMENNIYLAFDGKRKDGTYYTIPNATPIALNFDPLYLFQRMNNQF